MIAIEKLRELEEWHEDDAGEVLAAALPHILDVVEHANEAAASQLIGHLALSLGRLDEHFRSAA